MSESRISLRQMLGKSLTAFSEAGLESFVASRQSPGGAGTDDTPPWEQLCQDVNRALNARSTRSLLESAMQLDAEGAHDSALLVYTLSALSMPTAKAFNNIAVLYAEADLGEYALAWLGKGLDLFPHDATLLENQALLLE